MSSMSRRLLVLPALLALALAACERPASPDLAPTLSLSPLPPTQTPLSPPPTQPAPTVVAGEPASPPPPTPTSEPTQAPTPLPPATEPPSPTPTAGASPTATPLPTPSGPPLDPQARWGSPTLVDNMDSDANWAGQDGSLPDTPNIRLSLQNGEMLVTGKRLFFETWWFSWPFLSDFYLQMTARPAACAGKDAYGFILRGPPRGTGSGHGYVVAVSCDGAVMVRRIDGTDPYSAVDLLGWTPSGAVKAGAEQTNIVGVLAEGDRLTVYVNGFKVAEVVDATYREGRFGLWVRPDQTLNFTYAVDSLAYWDLTR